MIEITNPFSAITWQDIAIFIVPFLAAVFLDIFLHRKGEKVTMGNAAMWSAIWFCCMIAFGGYVLFSRGGEATTLYLTGAILEKALAVDNLFTFYLIFAAFGLTISQNQHFQHKILYWGILGAIVFRVVFLSIGAFIVNFSPYVLIVFALIVLWTVYKMWGADQESKEVDYTKHWSVNFVKRFAKTNPSIESGKFFCNGVTPLFLCLVLIEVSDLVFSFDSVPVILAVVRDPYLMITSSLWAAAGLRSLYFLLVAAQSKFWALDKAVMLLLVFVSFKLIGSAFHYHIPNLVSLSIVLLTLGAGVVYSLLVKEPNTQNEN